MSFQACPNAYNTHSNQLYTKLLGDRSGGGGAADSSWSCKSTLN